MTPQEGRNDEIEKFIQEQKIQELVLDNSATERDKEICTNQRATCFLSGQ
jgi:hypothetical protein